MRDTPEPTPFLEGPIDFSLVQGGPLFQLLRRSGLLRPPNDYLGRRIAASVLLTWAPLLVLSLLSGYALAGPGVPFLRDVAAHSRLLLCLPLFLAAEVIVHGRINQTVRQFVDRGIVGAEDRSGFERLIASAMRLRNSVPAELGLLAVAIVAAPPLVGARYLSQDVATWFSTPVGGQAVLTVAGYWYFFVSLPLFRFFMLRWYFRLFIWYRFLWQVSRRVRLRLNPLHPDRAGGLGFLSNSVFAYEPILIAHTVALSGILAGKIWHEGAMLPQFKVEITAWMLFLMLLALTPLTFFVTHLAAAKRAGLREYGLVASRYVAEFRRKWIGGQPAQAEGLLGTADIQSLADLSNSYDVVSEMGIVPFGRTTVARMLIMTALPFAPLTLTMVPLEQLIDRALAVFF